MKMRLYPSAAQRQKMDKICRALHIAYNITFHEVFQKNPMVCTEPKEDGSVWPDFRKMADQKWRHWLIDQNPAVEDAPAESLEKNYGLFKADAERAWKTGMQNRPIDKCSRQEFRFYNANKPRNSFFVQVESKNLIPSPDNDKVAWIKIPKVGKMKARGFNRKLWFGENGQYTYAKTPLKELPPKLSVRVSKDACGDYYVSITFSEGTKKDREVYLETCRVGSQEPIGIDVGVKDVAVLSNGQKIENRHYLAKKQQTLSRLNRKLSRQWGPANMAYRDYNKAIRQENRTAEPDAQQKLAEPSNRYLQSKRKKALIERRVARQRNTYYHQQTAAVVAQSSMIAMETLLVTNMKRNHKLAHALGDAAMSDFLAKLRYKAERFRIPIYCVGTFEPTSQLCSICGEKNPLVKNLSIRHWVCPNCGTQHDRDVNAAKNILRLAQLNGDKVDERVKAPPEEKSPSRTERRPRRSASIPEMPEVTIVFSKELTRRNDPRYVVKDAKTNRILDDAQGAGYKTVSRARNCYKAKKRWAEKAAAQP